MTPGHMTLTLGLRKNPQRKVVFLLEKTVHMCQITLDVIASHEINEHQIAAKIHSDIA